MTSIPDDAIRFRLTADVPCGWKDDPCKSPDDWPRLCSGCNGDGTRTVPTGIVVKRLSDRFAAAPDPDVPGAAMVNVDGPEGRNPDRDWRPLYREVQS